MGHSFPKWFYHKEIKPDGKIINSQQEFDKLEKGWEETPAAFDQKQDEKVKEQAPNKGKAGEGEDPEGEEVDYASFTVPQLKAALIEKGVLEAEFKGLKKDELIAKIEAM